MSATIKKILFPTDLTDHSRHAFQYAADIAGRYDASIVILHVMEELPTNIEYQLSGMLGKEEWMRIKELHMAEAKEILIGKMNDQALIKLALKSFWQDVKSDMSKDADTDDEVVVKEGNIADTIVEEAQTKGCDLIVMGYYSRNMIAEAMLRGITRRVLRRSKKLVLLVPKKERE